MSDLDPAGLEAAAKALQAERGAPPTHAGRYDSHRATVAVRAYLAAVLPPDESEAAKAVAAGRAAAHPDPPDMTNMCEGESPDHKPGITPAASPDERLREALTRIERLVARWDAPIRHDVDDRVAYEKWAAVGSEAHKIAADALAAADREAPDEGGGAMSEFRVVDANGDPYPPHAQPCRTLAAAALRRDFYQQVTSVSGEARMPVRPLRIERRSMVVSMWEPWNVGAASGLRKGASDE